MRDKIIVLIKQPHSWPVVRTIPNDRKTFESIVEGYVEAVQLRNNIIILYNQDAEILSSYHNKRNIIIASEGEMIDELRGTIIICSPDEDGYGDLETGALLDMYDDLCKDGEPIVEVKFT